jgi:hypothetical protein
VFGEQVQSVGHGGRRYPGGVGQARRGRTAVRAFERKGLQHTPVAALQLEVGQSAVAVNAIIVAVLTGPVVAYTRKRRGTSLLAACALMWIGCWVTFGLPLVISGVDGPFVVVGFAALSFGETMMAPILSPLAAALAPAGAVGRTMAAVTGAATVATAIGPILSSTLLGLELPAGFISLQVLFCLAAAAASMRLRGLMLRRVGCAGQASVAPPLSAVDLAA